METIRNGPSAFRESKSSNNLLEELYEADFIGINSSKTVQELSDNIVISERNKKIFVESKMQNTFKITKSNFSLIFKHIIDIIRKACLLDVMSIIDILEMLINVGYEAIETQIKNDSYKIKIISNDRKKINVYFTCLNFLSHIEAANTRFPYEIKQGEECSYIEYYQADLIVSESKLKDHLLVRRSNSDGNSK